MIIPSKKEIAESLGKSPEDVVIGYASTVGDLFHAGHVAYLRESRNNCDYLIVGLVDDPTKDRKWKNKPVQSLFERYIQIATCAYTDCVLPLSGEQDLYDSLELIRPDIRFVGEEYKGTVFTGSDIADIEIMYLPRQHSFSSSDLRLRVLNQEREENMLKKAVESEDTKDTEDVEDIGKQDY